MYVGYVIMMMQEWVVCTVDGRCDGCCVGQNVAPLISESPVRIVISIPFRVVDAEADQQAPETIVEMKLAR